MVKGKGTNSDHADKFFNKNRPKSLLKPKTSEPLDKALKTISDPNFGKTKPKLEEPIIKLSKHCQFCDKLGKNVCSDQRMSNNCVNITNKKEYFVWRETTEAKEGQPVGSWDYATNVAVTQEIARAICKLLECEHPGESFSVSSARPKSFYL